MDWTDLFSAVALLMIIEGVMPFVNPQGTRRALAMLSQLDDRRLRTMGVVAMIVGLIVLYIARL